MNVKYSEKGFMTLKDKIMEYRNMFLLKYLFYAI